MAAKKFLTLTFHRLLKMALELLRPMALSATTSGSQIPKDLVQVETEKRIPRNLTYHNAGLLKDAIDGESELLLVAESTKSLPAKAKGRFWPK
jgi:hypothetical protein